MCDFDVAKRVHIIKKFLEKKREKKVAGCVFIRVTGIRSIRGRLCENFSR